MDCDKESTSRRRYDLKYASYDALNTKKKYQHVQSKVKVYIENMRKEDQERRKIRIAHHRSEPSELADWHKPDDIGVKLNESSIDWKLVLEKKNIEFNEMKSKLNEMKTYGDTMNELLNAERLRRMELQSRLDAIRENKKIVNNCTIGCTWSDPEFRAGDRIAENVKIGSRAIDTTDDVDTYNEDEVFNNSIDWLGKVPSEEDIADENEETILLQSAEVEKVKKGIKYRVKKIFRCCTPCIKPKVE